MGYNFGDVLPNSTILRVKNNGAEFATFGDAKDSLLMLLRRHRDDYAAAVRRIKALTKKEADSNPYSVKEARDA